MNRKRRCAKIAPLRLWQLGFQLSLLLLLPACQSAPDLPSPAPEFARAGLPGDWIPDPEVTDPKVTDPKGHSATPARHGVSFTEKDGIAVLKITASAGRAFAGRRLDIALLASPYLRWAWYLETAPAAGRHISDATAPARNPMRLRIAFRGGSRDEDSTPPSPWQASGVPAHDRILDLVWESTPTRDDGVQQPPSRQQNFVPGCTVPCMPIQKKRTDSDQWWLEAADLEKIYLGFWPEDRLGEVHVVFVGLVLESAPTIMAGYLADLDFRR